MSTVILLLAVAIRQAPGAADDPAELVRRLGSPRFAERQAAEAALISLGESAFPELRRAAGDPDLERRGRAARLLERIEAEVAWRTLSKATPIRLDFVNRPLGDVVAEFGGPSLGRLTFHPATPGDVAGRLVTLREARSLPFWTALDRLCEVGDLHAVPGSKGGFGSGDTPHFRFYLVPGRIDVPHADFGPLRLEVLGLSHHRSINLVPNPPIEGPFLGRTDLPPDFEQRHISFGIDLRLVAEPRMLLEHVGVPIVTEAVDDRGQSLLPPPGPNREGNGGNRIPAQASWPLSVRSLQRPEHPGATIRRLRVTVPAVVVARRPDPLIIPLPAGIGKPFRHGDTTITVDSVEAKDAQGHPHVRLHLETDRTAPDVLRLPDDTARNEIRPAQPTATANVLEVLDDQGRLFPFVPQGNAPHPSTGRAATDLMLWPEGGIVIPELGRRQAVPFNRDREWTIAELRHYELARATLHATFEFHDLPLP